MNREILTAAEAAEYLRIHPNTLKRKARDGLLPGAKIGREWRFRKTDLDAWLAHGGVLRNSAGRSDEPKAMWQEGTELP